MRRIKRSFETPRAIHPTIQHHIPEDLNPKQHQCENFKPS